MFCKGTAECRLSVSQKNRLPAIALTKYNLELQQHSDFSGTVEKITLVDRMTPPMCARSYQW
ncbi:MAG: hypothetical protein GDA56_05790 [Hormoscilla sp. GM7CHS1pb]|nr:hypothetical protein [Hormoscilla sp. GM7CHS1pb]